MQNTTTAAGNATRADARAAIVAPGRYQDPATPVTPAEDLRAVREQVAWQLRTARVLTDLLTLAVRESLPPVAWTVGHAGTCLVGRCLVGTAGDRRRQFDAWCAAVGATPVLEAAAAARTAHLRAAAARYDGLVNVIVLADARPDALSPHVDEIGAGQ